MTHPSTPAQDRHDEVVHRCFQRMAGWVSLVVSTINAEWPAFETLTSAAAFSLSPVPSMMEAGAISSHSCKKKQSLTSFGLMNQ